MAKVEHQEGKKGHHMLKENELNCLSSWGWDVPSSDEGSLQVLYKGYKGSRIWENLLI